MEHIEVVDEFTTSERQI